MHWIPTLLVWRLYMFRAAFLPIIRSSEPYATRSRMSLQCHPTPGSIRSPQLHIMYQSRRTARNSWWWTERLPETCRVGIPIKLEFSVSVGFIHFNAIPSHGAPKTYKIHTKFCYGSKWNSYNKRHYFENNFASNFEGGLPDNGFATNCLCYWTTS